MPAPDPRVIVLGAPDKYAGGASYDFTTSEKIPAGSFIRVAGVSWSIGVTATDDAGSTYHSTFSVSSRVHVDTVTLADMDAGDKVTVALTGTGHALLCVYAVLNVDVSHYDWSLAAYGATHGTAARLGGSNSAPIYNDLTCSAGNPSDYPSAWGTKYKNISIVEWISDDSPPTFPPPNSSRVTSETLSSVTAAYTQICHLEADDVRTDYHVALYISYAIASGGFGVTWNGRITYNGETDPNVISENGFNDTFYVTRLDGGGKLSHAFLAPTGRRFVGAINDSGQAIIYLDDTLAATTETGTVVVVDSATTCVSPSVHVTPDGRVHYVYGRDGNSYYRYSKDAGKTWSNPMLISTGKTIPDHGWNDLVPAVALYNESDSTFYISTGSTDASGAITWNAPVSTGVTGLEVSPSLLCRPDGVWELVYQDNTGIQIKRCRNLRANGTGTWS